MDRELIIDCRDKACGLIPQMQELLTTTEAESVAFLVSGHILPQVANAFGSGQDWLMEVIEEPGHLRILFTRADPEADDPLRLI